MSDDSTNLRREFVTELEIWDNLAPDQKSKLANKSKKMN